MTASDRTLKARRYYLLPLALGIGFTAIASATHAFELADGTYETNQDNGVGVLTILDGQAKLAISGPGCVGGLEAPLRRSADGQVSFGQVQGSASCEVMLEQSDEGCRPVGAAATSTVRHAALPVWSSDEQWRFRPPR